MKNPQDIYEDNDDPGGKNAVANSADVVELPHHVADDKREGEAPSEPLVFVFAIWICHGFEATQATIELPAECCCPDVSKAICIREIPVGPKDYPLAPLGPGKYKSFAVSSWREDSWFNEPGKAGIRRHWDDARRNKIDVPAALFQDGLAVAHVHNSESGAYSIVIRSRLIQLETSYPQPRPVGRDELFASKFDLPTGRDCQAQGGQRENRGAGGSPGLWSPIGDSGEPLCDDAKARRHDPLRFWTTVVLICAGYAVIGLLSSWGLSRAGGK
jgi:hypothetical protein